MRSIKDLYYSVSNPLISFRENGLSWGILAITLTPVFSFLLILEFFIPKSLLIADIESVSNFNLSYNIDTYLVYLISSVSHIIISSVVIILLISKLRRNISSLKMKISYWNVLIACIIFISVFVLIDFTHVNLKILSHSRIYHVLSQSNYFTSYFQKFPEVIIGKETKVWFYLFSTIPFSLISLGLIIIVLACFNMGKDLKQILLELSKNPKDFDKKIYIKGLKRLQSYLSYLSIVLATSIVATILFFQIPVPVICDPEMIDKYKSVSFSMGICWGIVFSMTMLTMCFWPLLKLQNKISRIKDLHINANNPHVQWLQEINQGVFLFSNLRSLISIIAPTFISLLANFL